MSILIIAFVSWATLEVIKALRARHLERKRIEERNRRDVQIERLARERHERQRLAKEEHLRLVEEKIEQTRQAKKSDLEFKISKADCGIADIDERLADFYAQLDALLLQQAGTVPGSRQYDSVQSKIVTKRDQIRRSESKRRDLIHAMSKAQRELEVA